MKKLILRTSGMVMMSLLKMLAKFYKKRIPAVAMMLYAIISGMHTSEEGLDFLALRIGESLQEFRARYICQGLKN